MPNVPDTPSCFSTHDSATLCIEELQAREQEGAEAGLFEDHLSPESLHEQQRNSIAVPLCSRLSLCNLGKAKADSELVMSFVVCSPYSRSVLALARWACEAHDFVAWRLPIHE
eukprot:6202299-Amphidinium_carterae.1